VVIAELGHEIPLVERFLFYADEAEQELLGAQSA